MLSSSTNSKLFIVAAALLLPKATWARLGNEDVSHPRILTSNNDAVVVENEFILVTANGDNDATRTLVEQAGGSVVFTYEHIFQGMAVKGMDHNALVRMIDTKTDQIVSVIPNEKVNASSVQENPPWGLDRIDEGSYPLNREYEYEAEGEGVFVYVFDTGIHHSHLDFGGRSECAFNAINYETCEDWNYHGTHVAGTVGGATFGVAKKSLLKAVKVLDEFGSGTFSGVLAGLDFVLGAKLSSPDQPMVINMSLGGGFSTTVNDAVEACVAAGIVAVVAAGNGYSDACSFSPSSATTAITVGATAVNDRIATFSNQGSCVDILAPGVDIPSASVYSDYAVLVLSGTSMASPHVAGAAALYLEKNPTHTPKQVTAALLKRAAKNKIEWLYEESGTPNLMLRTKNLA